MSEKNELVYAIKNKNGQYWNEEYQFFSPELYMATFSKSKACATEMKSEYKFPSCKIIKVRIEEVEE